MGFQAVFKRYELKYLITVRQKAKLLEILKEHMSLDAYGRSTIRNIYYDTENYRLVRNSIEKPVYKEKLRIRSYKKATEESTVFVELKKKYEDIVYKRRIALPEADAISWISGGDKPDSSQIASEIQYFRDFYVDLRPAVFLTYEREAYFSPERADLGITFDENLLARSDNISLCGEIGGQTLLPEGYVLMEIKTAGGIPLWLTSFLTENGIYKCSFSKYGTAYTDYIFNKKGAVSNAC